MKIYQNLLKHVLKEGKLRDDRTKTGTISVFSYQMSFDLSDTFPLITTKKIHLKSVIYELLWFLSGNTNVKYLQDNGVRIWNEWADENGDLGKIYSHQWRSWTNSKNEKIDQISNVIESIKKNPYSRRHIVNAWNVGDLEEMALPPCHILFQFYVSDGKLSCQMYQRSADIFLGLPFNIASYSLMTMMIAQVTNLKLGNLIITLGDAHIYKNHIEQVKLQLKRIPRSLPRMKLNKNIKDIFDFKYQDFFLENYNPYKTIKGKISV